MIHTQWDFLRTNMVFPILKVRGKCDDKNAEGVLIKEALKIIKEVNGFNGALCTDEPLNYETAKISIYFSFIFKSEADFQRCWKYLNSSN